MNNSVNVNVSKVDSNNKNWMNKLLYPEVGTVIILIISVIVSTMLSPYFADIRFILDSTSMFVEFGIVALALTLVIIAGQIDLSLASNMALTGCVVATLFHNGVSMGVAIILGLMLGIVLGVINGIFVTKFGLPSIIVTIGTLSLYRGIGQIMMGDHSLGKFPEWFVGIDFRYLVDDLIPIPIIIFIILAIGVGIVLNFTVFGRQVYAIGTNETAARFSGIPVDRIKMILFCFSGFFGSLAGIMMVSRLGVSRFDMATGGELDYVTVVLLGGVDINGGKGNIIGPFIALFILLTLRTGMSVANIKIENQLAVLGFLLILSIAVSNFIYSKKS